jgi:hypothetical protein
MLVNGSNNMKKLFFCGITFETNSIDDPQKKILIWGDWDMWKAHRWQQPQNDDMSGYRKILLHLPI